MALTIEQILDTIAPQLISDTKKDDHIELAKLSTSTNCWGDKYNLAVALRAAHTLTLTDRENSTTSSDASGPITSKKEGDLSISYANTNNSNVNDIYLHLTSYGKQLVALRNGQIITIDITNFDLCCGAS